MRIFIGATLVVFGIIHLLPLSGILGTSQLERLYGVPINEPNLAILMRHRAILYVMLGLFAIYAAFRIEFQNVAFLAAFLSAGSFVWIAWSVGGYNAQVGRVVIADLIALAFLSAGVCAHVLSPNSSRHGARQQQQATPTLPSSAPAATLRSRGCRKTDRARSTGAAFILQIGNRSHRPARNRTPGRKPPPPRSSTHRA